jgi:hypothetical protein
MMTRFAHSMTVAALLAASPALADGQAWSIVGARTVETGANELDLSAGWPGISASYLRGVVPGVNLGARVSFAYGVEGLVRAVVPGFTMQALVKVRLLDAERLSLGLVFEPGPFFHFPSAALSRIGLALPIGLRVGIATSSALSLAVLLDVPMWVEFGPSGGFNIPILTGLGLEYFATSNLGVFARLQVGPTITPSGLAELTLDGRVGVAFHF